VLETDVLKEGDPVTEVEKVGEEEVCEEEDAVRLLLPEFERLGEPEEVCEELEQKLTLPVADGEEE